MRYAYPCVLTPEKGGGYSVSFPDVPEALTCGDDRDEALAMAEDALAVGLGAYMRCGEDIPVPGAVADGQEIVAVPPVVAAKLARYTAMREEGPTLPLTPLVPNSATIEAIREARRGHVPQFSSVEDLFDDLRTDD